MAYVAYPNTAQVSINWRLNSEIVQNNMFFTTPTGWSAPDLDNLIAGVFGWIEDALLPLLSEDIYVDEIVAVDRETVSGARVVNTFGALYNGEIVSDALPNQAALVVSFLTEQRGRAFRGRNYIAGLPDNATDNGLITITQQTNFQNAYNTLDTYFGLSDITHVIASASLVDPEVGGTGFTTPVTTYRINRSPGVRRSRRMP